MTQRHLLRAIGWRRSIVSLFVVMVVAVGLPAGSASAKSSGTASGPLVVGSFLALSGANEVNTIEIRDATQAEIDKVNASGGIHGRKLKYITYDDGYVPANSAAITRELVQQDGAFAILNAYGTNNVLAAIPFTEQNAVPIFGIGGYAPAFYQGTKYVFGDATAYSKQTAGLVKYIASHNPSGKVGIIYTQTAAGTNAASGAQAEGAALKKPVVAVAAPLGAPSFTSVIQQLKSAGVTQLIIATFPPPDVAHIVQEGQQDNWTPKLYGTNSVIDPTTISLAGSAVNGMIATSNSALANWNYPQYPGVKTYTSTVKKYIPKASIGTFGINAFADAEIFVSILKSIKGPITGKSFAAATERVRNFKTGIYGPVTFTKTQHVGQQSSIFVQVKKGAWLPLNAS